jgi:hypothetical protein
VTGARYRNECAFPGGVLGGLASDSALAEVPGFDLDVVAVESSTGAESRDARRAIVLRALVGRFIAPT